MVFVATFVATAIFSYNVYAQAMGCCTNPNALLPCSLDMTYVDDCCPFNDPSFYSNETGYGPSNYDDCILNYFFEGDRCEDIADCEVGCCCPPFGSPILPEYSYKATCVAPDYYFVGDISFFQNCTTICEVTPPEINVSECEYPEPQNLVAVHVKGRNSVWLDWSDECNATYFSVERCYGTRPECSQTDFEVLNSYVTKTYYTDNDIDLLWSISDTDKEVYTYRVTAHYYDQTHLSYVSLTRGDLECWEKYDSSAFCIHMQNPYNIDPVRSYLVRLLDPQNLTEFDQEIIRLFGIRFNKGYYCDDNNFLYLVKGCGDERYRVCTIDEGMVQCKDKTDCRRLGDPFNMDSSLGSCEENNYCFFDKSRTNVDACYDCSPEMVCYDYKTQGACDRDNCGLGNCEWRPIQIQGASELNLGVCIDTEGYNCKFCLEPRGTPGVESNEAYNYIFDKCTDERMAALSTERYDCSQELALCRERTCLNYTTGDECNKNGFLRRDNATNEMIVKSEDFCGIEVCNWRHNKCVKDADADEIPDCVYADDEVVCEMDYFPPETSLSWDDSVLSIQILDRISFGDELIDASSNDDYRVYLCRYTDPGTCRIAPDDYQEFNGPEITRQTLVSRGLIQSGENTIKYFSRDAYGNLEIVQSTVIKANPIVPFVLITSPSDGTLTRMSTITVKGIVQDWGLVDSASLLVNDNPISINLVQGEFSKTIKLEEGTSVLQAQVVTIEDIISKSYPVRVTYEYVDPAIIYIEPVPDSYISTADVTLKLQTNREGTCFYGITQPPSIRTGTFGTFTTEHMSAELTLNAGEHTYYFRCDFLDREENTISVYAQTSFFIDLTKPTAPVVDDSSNIPGLDPEYTYYTDRLYATWFATDPESGIAAYSYAVYYVSGTSEISVLGWRTTDQTSKWIMSLNLGDGVTYYVKAKAQNNAEAWGGEGSSDGVTVDTSMLPDQCKDGAKNGDETDIDCGGPQCPGCDDEEDCILDRDCFSGFCNEFDICATPSCTDYEKNQDETDIDCGGTICRRCGENEACILNSDCEQPELICKDHVCKRRIKPYCGDGDITAPEQCDGSNWGAITGCEDFDFTGGTLTCTEDDCVFNTSQCEGILPPTCGDGIIQVGEQCDGSNWGRIKGCWNFDNFTEGQLKCVGCTFDTLNCSRPPERICGDSTIQPGELCDGTNWGAITGCEDFDNFTGGTLRCIDCGFNTDYCIDSVGGFCGDGVIQVGELCDGPDWGDVEDCQDLGYFIGGTLRCLNCTFNTELCTPPPEDVCGNGIIDPGEQCDSSNWGNIYDCSDIGNFTEGNLSCVDCEFNTDQCDDGIIRYCGDGIIQVGEQCDGLEWGDIEDCADFGYDSGDLTCNVNCTFDMSDCEKEEIEYDKCSNGKLNFGETDVDCGGVCIAKGKLCGLGDACEFNSDCDSEYCMQGRCTQRLEECESGEVKDCMVGLCDGTQTCMAGEWSDCVKLDPDCDIGTGEEEKKGVPQVFKLLIWLFILIVLAVAGYFGLRYYQKKRKPPAPPRVRPRPKPPMPFRRFKGEEERRRVEALRERLKKKRRGIKETEREELFRVFEVPKKKEGVKVPKKKEKPILKKPVPKKEVSKKKPKKVEKLKEEDVFKKLRKETKELRKVTKKKPKK